MLLIKDEKLWLLLYLCVLCNRNPLQLRNICYLTINLSFQVGEQECIHMPLGQALNSTVTEAPVLETSPFVSLHLAMDSYPSIFFVINW